MSTFLSPRFLRRLRPFALLALLALAACAVRSAALELPPGHPADPAAPAAPERVVDEPTVPRQPAPASPMTGDDHAAYTCPMHPEVRSSGPGKCPQCGMNLVPMKDHPDEGPAHGDHR